jgi:hypothetical protein
VNGLVGMTAPEIIFILTIELKSIDMSQELAMFRLSVLGTF